MVRDRGRKAVRTGLTLATLSVSAIVVWSSVQPGDREGSVGPGDHTTGSPADTVEAVRSGAVRSGAVRSGVVRGMAVRGEVTVVGRRERVERRFLVQGSSFDVSTRWSTGDVRLSLTSPSGRVVDRDFLGGDVTHELGPTFESYHVSAAEPGTWTATLYGAQVATGGEPTRLQVHFGAGAGAGAGAGDGPTARFEQVQSGRTVSVDGSASSAPGGSIATYLWEFGDGATSGGVTASHTYTEPGTYRISLATQDDRGRWDVVTAPTALLID